jgi:hypothetical protein
MSPDPVHAVLGVVIRLPPEAFVPLMIGTAALLVLLFAGTALQAWKQRAPGPAKIFGLVLGAALTGASIYFLVRCIPNQSDPNNHGTGANLSFTDPPVAAFLAAIGAAFWRFGEQRKLALVVGLGIGALMIAKPFIWPVIRSWSAESGSQRFPDHARGMMDPEHLVFLGTGVVVVITGLVAGLRARRS